MEPIPIVQPLKFRNGYVISSHTLLGMWLLIHAGIKVTNHSKAQQSVILIHMSSSWVVMYACMHVTIIHPI